LRIEPSSSQGLYEVSVSVNTARPLTKSLARPVTTTSSPERPFARSSSTPFAPAGGWASRYASGSVELFAVERGSAESSLPHAARIKRQRIEESRFMVVAIVVQWMRFRVP
jgi:hypothetical protein